MIRYLLGQEYMGLHVGPEPTTDRYVAIVHGDTDDVIQVGLELKVSWWCVRGQTPIHTSARRNQPQKSRAQPVHSIPQPTNQPTTPFTKKTGQGADGEPDAALQGDGGLRGPRRQVPGRGA